ncbi:hypothetical protein [Embleya scabrispora]|uniref:hypothetical protein n=1 Tax=Embleya scabrispora TaxID=159449 RepID=UPI0003764FC1|nr:hypothetical protein [Embleya scabrispora]MYS87504.1 hypothetical protein [Streptomyces sp. SID5474]
MSKLTRRMAGLALAASASVGLVTAGAGSAQAASGSYIATYRYLDECRSTGAMYVHYAGASTYHCTGNGAVGFSLYVEYWA